MLASEEMANDEIKKQREAHIKEGISDSRLAQVEVQTISLYTWLLWFLSVENKYIYTDSTKHIRYKVVSELKWTRSTIQNRVVPDTNLA